MGSAVLIYYPRGSTTHKTITLSRLSDLIVENRHNRRVSLGMAGKSVVTNLGSFRTVRIVSERITSASLIRDLRALRLHLAAGGRVAFCRDLDKLVAYRGASSALVSGATSIPLASTANVYANWNASAALSAGDEITIEDSNPDLRRDFVRYASLSGATLTASDAVTFGYSSQTLIRYADLYPVLLLPEGAAEDMLSEHRRSWTLSLELLEMPAEVNQVSAAAELLAKTGQDTDGGGFTLEMILDRPFERTYDDLIAGGVNNWSLYGMG